MNSNFPSIYTNIYRQGIKFNNNLENKKMYLSYMNDYMGNKANIFNKDANRTQIIDENMINDNLYTAGLEDPNLVIRTSGEERLSGFLLWQSSYSELYFTDSLWPELRKVDFLRAIRSYTKRQRRFGK